MKEKNGKKIDDLNQFLATVGPNLNILEEEVDIRVQKQYFELLDKLGESPDDYPEHCRQYVSQVNDLFDPSVDEATKRQMLVVLATVDDISIYRAIESLATQKTPLRKWAVIALQQSRMLIQSNLMDDPGVFISTGLGGHGLMLRYFCVFVNRVPAPLPEFQRNIVRTETEAAIIPLKGSIEQISFTDEYTTMLMLLPLQADLQTLFGRIVEECNQFGNFLHENMLITNVKKLSDTEIRHLLHSKRKKEEEL